MTDVLVIDPSPLNRELLGRILEVHGYASLWGGIDEAVELLRRVKPGVLILEPGPAGAEGWRLLAILRRAREEGECPPVVILSEASEKSDVLRAAEMGVRSYMLKQRFSLPEFLTRIRRHVAPSRPPQQHAAGSQVTTAPAGAASSAESSAPVQPIPAAAPRPAPTPGGTTAAEDSEAITQAAKEKGIALASGEQTLRRLEQAPVKTLPGVVAELIGLVSSPRGTAADIALILRRDPVLTARVLRVANSAAFSSERVRVSNVEDAVKNIGVTGVRNLVLNVGVFDAFAAGSTDGARVMRAWQHCLGVAMLMEKLAPQDVSVPPGSAYLVGLCHDLADIVLRQHFAAEYEQITSLVSATGRPLRQAEAVVFGLPYGELVSHLLGRLRLPPLITLPIEEFFERGDRKAAVGAGSLLGRALRALNVYAHGLMLAPDTNEPITPITRAEWQNTFGASAAPVFDDDLLRGEALSTAAVLGGLNAAQTQEFCEPLVQRQSVRACYSRHDAYGEMDPLGSLLKLTCAHLHILPPPGGMQSDALEKADVLVVAGPRGGSEAFSRDLDFIRKLLAGRSMPVLYLGGGAGTPPADLPFLTMRRLPISIEAVSAFLKECAAQIGARPQSAAA